MAQRVQRLVAERAGPRAEPIGPDQQLADLGLDSVGLLELLLEAERACGATLPPDLLAGPPLTVGELVAALAGSSDGGREP